MMSSTAVLMFLTFCALIKEGLTITCYMCNSAPSRNNHLCGELKGNSSIFYQDCDELSEARRNLVNYTVCRKMTQKIFDKDGNEEERVIRQCGTEGPLGCSWRTRPNTLQVETCHCNTRLCNTAVSPASTVTIVIICIAAMVSLLLVTIHPSF